MLCSNEKKCYARQEPSQKSMVARLRYLTPFGRTRKMDFVPNPSGLHIFFASGEKPYALFLRAVF